MEQIQRLIAVDKLMLIVFHLVQFFQKAKSLRKWPKVFNYILLQFAGLSVSGKMRQNND